MTTDRHVSVLIINLSKRYGGAEVRVVDTASMIHGRISYAVATLRGSPLHERLCESNLVALPMSYLRSDPRILFKIMGEIREGGFSVVDAHNSQSQFWGILAATLAKVPVKIATVHSTYRTENRGLKGWLYEKILKLDAMLKCQFIAVSRSVYEYLLEIGISEGDISLIYNSTRVTEKGSLTRNVSLRESLGWGRDAFVVIAVGRIEPVKGHRYLIDSIHSVLRERPNIRCIIVGEGRARESLEIQARRLGLEGIVHFTGFRRDVSDILLGSDAFCMPSLSEGLPYALLEACAARLPLVVTKVGEMAKLLSDGENALMVPPRDSGALEKSLIHLIDHPEVCIIFGNAAFELVKNKLSLEKMITSTLEVYNKNVSF